MESLVNMWFAPWLFWTAPSVAAPREPEHIIIHLSASRKWRRRMKIIRRARQ